MTFLRWTEKMSVGSPDLDEDHKQLFYLTNRLSEIAEGEVSTEDARQALYGLVRYALLHFAREEGVMAACGFPEQAEHKTGHTRFVATVDEFLQRFEKDPDGQATEVCRELFEFLKDWLTHHILIQDMAYKSYVEAKPAEAVQAAKAVRGADLGWS